jgi:hypothetical protein
MVRMTIDPLRLNRKAWRVLKKSLMDFNECRTIEFFGWVHGIDSVT